MDKKNRKKWTGEQKLEVLNYCKQEGVGRTSREYGISTTIIYQWQRKFEMGGIDELEGKKTKDRDSRLYELERENRELKAIVAEKEMQIRSAERSNKKKPTTKLEGEMIAREFIDIGYPIGKTLEWLELSKSGFNFHFSKPVIILFIIHSALCIAVNWLSERMRLISFSGS